MKIMNKLSVVFAVFDSVTKKPVKNATVLCDGKRREFIFKKTGMYVFLNIEYGTYTFDVSANGYAPRSFRVNISQNGVKATTEGIKDYLMLDSDIINCAMNRNVSLNCLSPCPHAIVKKNGEICANTWLDIVQDTKIPYLRITKSVMEGAESLILNTDFNSVYMFQSYYMGMGYTDRLFINGYNALEGSYTLMEPISKNMKTGALLRPFWRVKTDEKGMVSLPFSIDFFYQSHIYYAFVMNDDSVVKLEIDVGDGIKDNEVNFV